MSKRTKMAKKKKSGGSLNQPMTFSTGTVLIFALIFALVGLIAVFETWAAPRPGGGSSASISLKLPPDTDNNGDGQPNYLDAVSFNISTTATAPFVHLKCYQNGTLVADGSKGYFSGSLDTSRSFGLNSGIWQGGAADCKTTVEVYSAKGKSTWTVLGTTSFHVNP
jgi:hypothetical protein